MEPSVLRVGLYGGAVAVSAWLGGMLPLEREWRRGQLRLLISFGAGVLLGAAFLHLLPQAYQLMAPNRTAAGGLALAGFLLLFVIEKYVMVHACEGDECDFHTAGLAAFVGLSVHSLLEGLALGSTAAVPSLALVVMIAIIAHKAPSSLSLAALLLAAGYKKPRVSSLVLLFSLMVPAGALVAVLATRSLSESVVGGLVAVSSGTFILIAGSDLLPEVHRVQPGRTAGLVAFLLGVALMWAASLLHPHA